MNKLYSQRLQFHTLELLESFVDLSYQRGIAFADMTPQLNPLDQYRMMLTSFGTGRQSGKTTAVADFLENNLTSTVVVVPNIKMKFNLMSHGSYSEDSRIITASRGENPHEAVDLYLKAIDNLDYKQGLNLIFDECSSDEISATLNRIADLWPRYGAKVRSIVSVGER